MEKIYPEEQSGETLQQDDHIQGLEVKFLCDLHAELLKKIHITVQNE